MFVDIIVLECITADVSISRYVINTFEELKATAWTGTRPPLSAVLESSYLLSQVFAPNGVIEVFLSILLSS